MKNLATALVAGIAGVAGFAGAFDHSSVAREVSPYDRNYSSVHSHGDQSRKTAAQKRRRAIHKANRKQSVRQRMMARGK